MKKLLRRVALTVTSLGLSVGWAGVAAADTNGISNTGSDSVNVISCNIDETYTLKNNNTVGVDNFNLQFGGSGEAESEDNTTGGSVMSGSVSNSNSVATSVSVNNG